MAEHSGLPRCRHPRLPNYRRGGRLGYRPAEGAEPATTSRADSGGRVSQRLAAWSTGCTATAPAAISGPQRRSEMPRDYEEASFWLATAWPYKENPPLDGDTHVDVAGV